MSPSLMKLSFSSVNLRRIDERLKANSVIEEDVYQVRNRSGQDPLNFPIKLNNKIAALGASIERGDGKPTVSSYEVYKLLNQKLAEQQAKLDTLLKTTLPSVNKELASRSLQELIPTKTETPAPKPVAAPPVPQ